MITLGALGLFYTLTTSSAGLQPEPHHYTIVGVGVIGFCAKPKPTTPHTPHPAAPIDPSGTV